MSGLYESNATDGRDITEVVVVDGYSGTLNKVEITSIGELRIAANTLPLPAGAATSANQLTGNSSLSSIDQKLNTLGQKTMAGSVPVVLATDQTGLSSKADDGNSTTTPLGSNATFTGTAIDIKDYSAINVAAFSDVSSATDGLKMQFSPDGINWDHAHSFSVAANVGVSYAQAAELRYFRIVYTNGPLAQTFFRLTTILKSTNVSPSRYTVGQQLQGTQMADVTKSVIWGLSSQGGGTYYAAKVTPSGSFITAIGDISDVAGQKLMVDSFPVTIASNQSAVPASQSGTWNINQLSTILNPLPTGTNDLGNVYINGSAGTKIGQVNDALKVSIASEFITASVATYIAAVANVTAATNPTDIFLLRGSATKKVKIIDLQISMLKNTTGYNYVVGYKRSTDNTGGTFTTVPIVAAETAEGASGAQVRAYTANPTTLGTNMGLIYSLYAFIPAGNAAGGGNIAGVDIVHGLGKPITLTGTNECFAISMEGQGTAGLTYCIMISWIEE